MGDNNLIYKTSGYGLIYVRQIPYLDSITVSHA